MKYEVRIGWTPFIFTDKEKAIDFAELAKESMDEELQQSVTIEIKGDNEDEERN